MKRLHLVELEDLPWVPAVVRDGGTDLLDALFARVGFYRPLVGVFARIVRSTGAKRVVDLCSGGGGGLIFMVQELEREGVANVEFVLTDRYPNASARERALKIRRMDYRMSAVDAMRVPRELDGLRTMFGALHHFRPEDVRGLLADAISAGAPVAFFDVAAKPFLRRLPDALAPLVALPNAVFLFLVPFLLVPFVRPFRFSRVVLTYLAPLIPLLFAWDGTVSSLRAYEPDELLELARSMPGGERFAWEAGTAGQALYLTGSPISSA